MRDLVRARWALIGTVGVLAGLVATWTPLTGLAPAAAGLPGSHRVGAFVAVLTAWALLNLWNSVAPSPPSRARAGLHLVADVAALTGLLAASGGASNPFTALYFVPLTLATQISPRWAWAVGGSAVVGFGLLLISGVGGGAGAGLGAEAGPHAGHAQHFVGHLRGMWIALGVAGSLLTYFVHRIAVSRTRERAELARLRREALEDRHLTALGTLAAGAAHELATPLGTVQVLAGELPHMDEAERTAAVASMRAQIGRCKEILGRMASPDLRIDGVDAADEGFSLASIAEPLARLGSGDVAVQVEQLAAATGTLRQPRRAMLQILTELVHNAVTASRLAEATTVHVAVETEADGWLHVSVVDQGGGIERVDRAVEPFFTTRPEGEGMGLGLYLVRAHVRQLGGRLALDDRPGEGLTATVSLPGYVEPSASPRLRPSP